MIIKKRKNEEKDGQNAKFQKMQETANIIQQLPVSNSPSPIVIIPILDYTTNSTSVNRETDTTETALIIDESCTNTEDSNDQIADSTDQTGTQESKIDSEIQLTCSSSSPISDDALELNRVSYKLGLQHKQDEYCGLVNKLKREHEQVRNNLIKEKRHLEQALLVQIEHNEQQLKRTAEEAFLAGVNAAHKSIFQSLQRSMFQLNPVLFSDTYEIVRKTAGKQPVLNKFEFT